MTELEPKTVSELSLPACRVLVAEPSVTLRLLIRGLLRQWGCVAETAAAGADLDSARQGFDLLVARRGLTVLGSSVAGAAADPWLAVSRPGDALAAPSPDRWVILPVQPRSLHQAVAQCLQSNGQDAIDPDAIAALWGDVSNPVFGRVAAVFLSEMRSRLSVLRRALAQDDRDSLQLEAHSVGSSAANVGCMAITRAARNLEAAVAAGLSDDFGTLTAMLIARTERDLPVLANLARAPA